MFYRNFEASQVTLDEIKKGHPGASDQLQVEINKLRAIKPVMFEEREISDFNNFGPSLKNADIFFLAVELCTYDLATLQREFPALSYIYHPVFLGDLNNDGEDEVLTVSDMEPSVTDIVIFQQEDKNINMYQKVIEVYRMDVFVHEMPDNEKQIIGRSRGERRVQVKGTNELVTLEYVREMILRFTGSEIEIVRPLMVVDEQVVLDD